MVAIMAKFFFKDLVHCLFFSYKMCLLSVDIFWTIVRAFYVVAYCCVMPRKGERKSRHSNPAKLKPPKIFISSLIDVLFVLMI
jgi:hypothetical protein